MIYVYHNADAITGNLYGLLMKNEPVAIPFSRLSLVAEVDTDNLKTAYALTNTKEKDWWKNELVVPRFSGPDCRSTSIGDVMVLDGEHYAVAPIGFVPVSITS